MGAEYYVVDEQGNRIAVILSLQEYEQLLEDIHDLAVAAERRDEPAMGFSDTDGNGRACDSHCRTERKRHPLQQEKPSA